MVREAGHWGSAAYWLFDWQRRASLYWQGSPKGGPPCRGASGGPVRHPSALACRDAAFSTSATSAPSHRRPLRPALAGARAGRRRAAADASYARSFVGPLVGATLSLPGEA